MTLNQLKLLYPYCTCHTKKEMYTAALKLFQYFAMVPALVENSYFLVYLFLNFFLETVIMTGEPTHTVSKERNGTVHPSFIV